jgi:Protein of unknown function (DUF3617)
MRQIHRHAILAAMSIILASCNQASNDAAEQGGASVDPVKAAADLAFQFKPGKYRTTVEVQKLEIPGMPAAMAGQMKAMMSEKTASESCISPEQSKRGLEIMKEHMGKGKCRFEKFDAAAGSVDSVFTCDTGEGMQLKAVSKGTYTDTGSQAAITADMTVPGGRAMHVEQTVRMERIGECT